MEAGGCEGRARGSPMRVTARQRAQRMDPAPSGNCRGVRQLEQFTSMLLYIVGLGLDCKLGQRVRVELGFLECEG